MPRALVTGASGGIGLELATVLARDGHDLVLVARSGAKLDELAGDLRQRFKVSTKIMPKDLADPASPPGIVSRLEAEGLAVDVLVNNAGFATSGRFSEADASVELDEIQVNVVALTQLTKLLLPGMLGRRSGRILNVASTAAFFPGPLMAVYYATKAYVLSFSEALARELEGTGVTVTALCPGPTRTGFQERAELARSKLFSGKIMGADEVARAGYEGLMRGDSVVIPGLGNKLRAQLPRVLPRRAVTHLVQRAHREV